MWRLMEQFTPIANGMKAAEAGIYKDGDVIGMLRRCTDGEGWRGSCNGE